MTRGTTQSEAALELAAKHGVLRLRDAQERGIHHEVLRRLVTEGKLIKVARGMYTLAEESTPTDFDLSLAAARVPNGVVCLISALFHYGIGTQMPHEVWMMIDRRAHRPKVDYPPMRFVLGSGASLKEGVETVVIDEHDVRIFNPAKTVVDCFRYRRHVGLDVALEALRESLRDRRCTPAQIWHFAEKCRVTSVLKPYLEAMS